MGSERASIIMNLVPPVGWGEVATRTDLAALGAQVMHTSPGCLGEDSEALRDERLEEPTEQRAVTGDGGTCRAPVQESVDADAEQTRR